MIFPEKIKSIALTDNVIEVGPGANPFWRSDVLLEKTFSSEAEAQSQKGCDKKLKTSKKIIYYEGPNFPFEINEFDYSICSHVLEHISEENLNIFIKELQRVSKKGYIEFPTIYYEIINFQSVHKWFMLLKENKIFFLKKENFDSDVLQKILRYYFYNSNDNLIKLFQKQKNIFFHGYEWNDNIDYVIVNKLEELITDNDFNKIKTEIDNSNLISYRLKKRRENMKDKLYYYAKRLYYFLFSKKVSRTAILEKKN